MESLPDCTADTTMGVLVSGVVADRHEGEALVANDPASRLTIKATVSAEDDGGDALYVDLVSLHITSGPLCVHVSLGATSRFDALSWQLLAAGEDAAMTLTRTNGEVSISSSKGRVTLAISRFGGGDDSGITIHGPAALFARVFAYIARRVGEIRGAVAREVSTLFPRVPETEDLYSD
jgi:hypothetical protein